MKPRRIFLATDAWHPQVNGVVRTLDTTMRVLRERGHQVTVVQPGLFAQVGVPFYPEIRLALARPGRVADLLQRARPDHVHISTEGPLGQWVRRACRHRSWNFSTSYHTRFPEYLHELVGLPMRWTYAALRRFHNAAGAMMTATPSLEAELIARGFTVPIRRWSRGVDAAVFRPRAGVFAPYPRPILLYVGRVSAEKGVEDFLKLTTPGTKVIVGDGPQRAALERAYPAAKFLGYRRGDDLAACYATADAFVFPSKTDTFGLVIIEALAAGVPVAAYPVTGPKDILARPELGALHDDLGEAIRRTLADGRRDDCLREAANYTWDRCTDQFLANLVPTRPGVASSR